MNKEQIIVQLKEAQAIIDGCIKTLGAIKGVEVVVSKEPQTATPKVVKVDFSLNARNFVKVYGKSLSGPKKFVLLLAYLSKGKVNTDTEAGAVSALWGKMTGKDLLGYAYNGKYPTAAKDGGWIDSKKYGTYYLRSNWMSIFS